MSFMALDWNDVRRELDRLPAVGVSAVRLLVTDG